MARPYIAAASSTANNLRLRAGLVLFELDADAVCRSSPSGSGEAVGQNGLRGALPIRGRRVFAPVGLPWVALADPFPSLLELWEHGVAVERLEANTIVLALAPCG